MSSSDIVPLSQDQDLQQLPQMISAWKEVSAEATRLKEAMRDKKVRLKALEEVILRTMKKHNIGALDLKGSGGRILYRRSSSKTGINDKVLFSLLSDHLKSEVNAAAAVKYINEHREVKPKESLVYEKE